MVCLKCHGVSALFSGVSIVFADVSRIVVVCPLCLLVFSECWDVSALISGVTRMWSCARLVLWCVQDVAVFRPYFMVCPERRGVSALFSGLSAFFPSFSSVAICLPCFPMCPCTLIYGVSRVFCGVFRA